MEIKGKVIHNLGTQSGTSKSGKDWIKASVVIETEGQYPKRVMIDNLKNAIDFAKLKVGDSATFHIEINSNEYNGRWYTSVTCWKWETDHADNANVGNPANNANPAPSSPFPNIPNTPIYPEASPFDSGNNDDLPF